MNAISIGVGGTRSTELVLAASETTWPDMLYALFFVLLVVVAGLIAVAAAYGIGAFLRHVFSRTSNSVLDLPAHEETVYLARLKTGERVEFESSRTMGPWVELINTRTDNWPAGGAKPQKIFLVRAEDIEQVGRVTKVRPSP